MKGTGWGDLPCQKLVFLLKLFLFSLIFCRTSHPGVICPSFWVIFLCRSKLLVATLASYYVASSIHLLWQVKTFNVPFVLIVLQYWQDKLTKHTRWKLWLSCHISLPRLLIFSWYDTFMWGVLRTLPKMYNTGQKICSKLKKQ